MGKLLSILIPTIGNRKKLLYQLLSEFHRQMENSNSNDFIEILIEDDEGGCSVGAKRQLLLERAKGYYIVFCDDDDEVSVDYISSIIEAAKIKPDVIGFSGFMTTDNTNRENFKISKDLPYITISDPNGKKEFLRYNNHLSPIKREIAIQIGYKDLRFGEDYDYAKRLKESGLVKTEYYINKDLYHYKYVKEK